MSDPIIFIDPIPVDLKACHPNLMPFHISFTGPAAVATFMSVKPAKVSDCEPTETKDPSVPPKEDQIAVDAEPQPVTTDEQESEETQRSQTPPIPPPEGSAEKTPEESGETFSPTRSVSTFRGRTIQGLTVDLPQGYRGLVLQAPPTAQSTSASSSSSKTKTSSQNLDPVEEAPTTTRRKGRLTRSAVSKKVINVEEEEAKELKAKVAAAIDVENLMDLDETLTERDHSLQRRLQPVAQFSSFTLWHADHPVVETQDEYYRSVHEWTGLAAMLHQDEGDEEAR